MQRLFDRLKQQVEDFVEQRDDLLMVISCSDADAALVAQTISDVEQADPSDVFFIAADRFVMPGPYVSVLVERLKEQHGLACQALEEEGRPALPPVPAALDDALTPPFERLLGAITFARSLLPADGDHRLIWVMAPLDIADRTAYLKLVTSFIPWQGIEPWMRGVRLVCRDHAGTMQVAPSLARAPRTRVLDVDLGQEAIQESMAQDVEDEDLPMEKRMQAVLSLALFDFAYGRTGQAMVKYQALLGYYQHTGNKAMEAFVLNAIGDIDHHREDNLELAQYWYECAVPPALEADAPVIFYTIVKNLATVAFKRKQYPEAEQYFDGAEKLATHLKDARGKADMLEWRGLSQEQQHRFEEAEASWQDAATLSRNVGMPASLKANLQHLGRLYERLRMPERLRSVKAELAGLKRQEAAV